MPHRILEIDSQLFAAIGLVVSGLLSRYLVSDTPFKMKFFVGELIAAILVAIAIYTYGEMQHLSTGYMILVSIFMGLGITRSLEWVIKIATALRKIGS